MRNANGTIDWTRTEAYARSLDREALLGAIRDARATLDVADTRDRIQLRLHGAAAGPSEGGYYRDCISVYQRVLTERQFTCARCGGSVAVTVCTGCGQEV